jgi:hypothetical protein
MRSTGAIHFARIENSDRLRRVLAVLSDRQPHSTMEIVQAAEVCAVNSAIAELRMNGIRIECRQVGRERFEYTLVEQLVTLADPPPEAA